LNSQRYKPDAAPGSHRKEGETGSELGEEQKKAKSTGKREKLNFLSDEREMREDLEKEDEGQGADRLELETPVVRQSSRCEEEGASILYEAKMWIA